MLLPDFEIFKLGSQGLAHPFDATLINPASLDVRLGENIMIEQDDTERLCEFSIHDYSRERPFRLAPGEFILAETLETFKIPDDTAAQFALKSSLARAGFEHLMAGFVDPGWQGTLTLELKNARQAHPIPIWPGMRIGQLTFQRLICEPCKNYEETGRYFGDKRVTACKGLL